MSTKLPSRSRGGGSIIRVKKRAKSFSIVPDALIQDKSLRIDTRLWLAYVGGRPEGWEPRVGQTCRAIGMTDWAWRQIKEDLLKHKILTEFECTSVGAAGFKWVMEIDLDRYF